MLTNIDINNSIRNVEDALERYVTKNLALLSWRLYIFMVVYPVLVLFS